MKSSVESITQFCLIQLEILRTREIRLRRDIQDCNIQREFLSQVLEDIGGSPSIPDDLVLNLIGTTRSPKK
jgi:hypothetical protein